MKIYMHRRIIHDGVLKDFIVSRIYCKDFDSGHSGGIQMWVETAALKLFVLYKVLYK